MKISRVKLVSLVVIAVALVILIGVGASYAIWFASLEQTGSNTATSECLNLDLTEGAAINVADALPMIDSDGLNTEPYTFSVENTCNLGAEYTIKVKVESTNTLDPSLIKVNLDNKAPMLLSDLPTTDSVHYAYSSFTIAPGESATHNFRTWVDESGTVANALNKRISVKIVLDYVVVDFDDRVASTFVTNLAGNGEVFDENGIRYQGTDPNNYVVLEEGGEVYRIIGVFDTLLADGTTTESLVKLIKEESIGNLAWDAGNVNDWNTSDLKTTLNTNFLNSTGSYTANGLNNQKEMIADVTWNLGGLSSSSTTAVGFYNAERGTTVYSGRSTTGTGKVGLMYPSDYMYAVKETDCARTTISNPGYSSTSSCHNNNWLYSEVDEWSLAPNSSSASLVWYVHLFGLMNDNLTHSTYVGRPTVYLKENAYIASGTGSAADPYLIQIPPPPAAEQITNLVGNGEVFDENGIRYQGTDPNNYVLLEDGGEVYRIIGVFDTLLADGTTTESLVKLIKDETIGNLAWDADNVNDWNASDLKTTLNTNFLNSTGSYTSNGLNKQKDTIIDVTWNLGGNSNLSITAENLYNAERGTTVYTGRSTTGTGKIGLMYPSDYMYAVKATDCARTTVSFQGYQNTTACHDNNWLFDLTTEWTITPNSLNEWSIWAVVSNGIVSNDYTSNAYSIRPALYLNTTAKIIGGSGSIADPYLIN